MAHAFCRWSRGRWASLLAAGVIGGSRLGAADLPLARLDSLSLPVFAVGEEAETVLSGSDLEGVESLWFSHPGITARWVKDKTFVVRVDASVIEGAYDVRAVGAHGVSNPRGIFVDRVAARRKTEATSVSKPMLMQVGQVISGTVSAASRDAFQFEAKAGQRLTVRCMAREIDSKLVPMLSVVDESGRRLSSGSRVEVMPFVPRRDGRYTVVLHDLTFSGGADYRYRISVDEAPWLVGALPAVVEPGKKSRIVFFGKGFSHPKPASEWLGPEGEAWEAEEREIEVPSIEAAPRGRDGVLRPGSAGVSTFAYRFRGSSGVSNAVEFLLAAGSPLTVRASSAPSTAGTQPASALTPVDALPSAFSGFFAKDFQGSGIEWRAKVGEVLRAEVFSQRLGFESSNPFLRLHRANQTQSEAYGPEANPGGPKLSTIHNDPGLRFEVKEEGVYQLRVSDLTGAARSGVSAVYAVVLGAEPAKFRLVAATEPPPESTNDRAVAPRGAVLRSLGTSAVRVVALRSPGFSEAIELEARNLPEGVQSDRTVIPAGKNEGVLILKGNGNLPKACSEIGIVGRAVSQSFESVACGAVCMSSVTDTNLEPASVRLTRGPSLVLGTTPNEAPIALHLVEVPRIDATVGDRLEVSLKVLRKPEFQVPLKLKPGGFSGAETAKEADVAAKEEVVKVPLDLAALKLGEGHHSVFFTAQAKAKFMGKEVVTTVYSPPVQIQVRPAAPSPRATTSPTSSPPEGSPEKPQP